MASLKEFLGSTGLSALWARITEELNKKATSADLADVATSGSYNDLEDKPFIPSAISDLTDDSGHYTKPANGIPASDLEETYLTSFTETDPTVPSWAKEAEKPTYTAAEVGAMATDHPANNITAGNIENWTKQANLLSVDSDHNNVYDYWWTLTIPRNALWNINNAPGSSGNLKYLYVPSTTGSNLVKLELPTSNGKLALISDTPAWARAAQKPTYTAQEVGALPADTVIPTVPTNVSAFTNDAGYLTQHQDISGKADKSEIPTSVSELTNDAGYITGYTETDPTVPAWAKASTKPSYTAAEVGAPTVAEMNSAIGDAIGNVHQFEVEIVQELPVENIKEHTVYFVPKSGATDDVYDEYVYIDNAWEMIGNTQIDLSNYVQKTDYATTDEAGIVKIGLGFTIDSTHTVSITTATDAAIKAGTTGTQFINPRKQHASVFYGLAKVAGDTTQAQSSNTIGTYTDEAKTAIRTMLGVATPADIPTNISAFTNDAGYLTQHQDISGKANAADLATVATSGSYEDLSNKPTIPEVPVQDVQVNGTSVLSSGIANIPLATNGTFGLVRTSTNLGVYINNENYLNISGATSSAIKSGDTSLYPLTPQKQHESVFYGLTKAAGVDMSSSSNAVGTYTESAKTAIRSMIGATSSNVIAVQDTQPVEADAKIWMMETAPESVEIPTMEDLEGYVQKTDLANGTDTGVVKVNNLYGVGINANGILTSFGALNAEIKGGTEVYRVITPQKQHMSVFYGLAKAAGDTTMASSSNAVGTYTTEAKAAIHTMLGIDPASIAAQVDIPLVETVSGTTPTITGQPNVRYVCGEVSTITITPPASGSVDVIFESGSTATAMTVPSTVKWPAWFDAETLETNTTYEILITDGIYGSVMTWAT